MQKSYALALIILGVFLAGGIATAGYFIGQTMYNAKAGFNTASVKGLAERRVEADLATWRVGFSLVAPSRDQVARLYDTSEAQQQKIIAVLKQHDFEESEIKLGAIDYSYQEIRNNLRQVVEEKHVLRGYVSVETDKVHSIEHAMSDVNKLVANGINIESQAPQYHFTQLNSIKPDMLKQAAKNARIAAEEFAENAGVKVGRISNARQGSFEIKDVGENYGSTQKIEKDVRVVTTISFYLTD